MPSINLTKFENVVAHTISEINSTSGVANIRNIYANQSDITDLLNNKADQVDTYTKAQIDANFYDITQSYNKTEVNVLSNNISSNAYFIMNSTATIASKLVYVSANTFLIGNLTITSNTNFNSISSNTHLINIFNSSMTSNFNSISSNSNSITGLNSTINSHITTISDLQNEGSFDSNLYYRKTLTDNLLSVKLDTSILNSKYYYFISIYNILLLRLM